MGAMIIEADEYPGRPGDDARRSLDGEPSSYVEQHEMERAAAAAAAQHYYASQQQQQRHHHYPSSATPPSAIEWQELAANLGSIHVGEAFAARQQQQQQQQQQDNNMHYHHHHHHHQASLEEEGRNKRLHEHRLPEPGMAPCYGGYDAGGYYGLPGGGGSSSMMDDDEMALGAPPLLPPTLKRARGCSYSPQKSGTTRDELFSDESDPRQ